MGERVSLTSFDRHEMTFVLGPTVRLTSIIDIPDSGLT